MYTTETERPCTFKDRLHWPFTISRCYAHSFYAKRPCSFGIGLWPTRVYNDFWSFPCSTKIIIILIQWLLVSRTVFILYKTRWRLCTWFKTDNQLNRFFTHDNFFLGFCGVIGGKKVVTFFHFRSLSWALSGDFSSFSSFYFSYRFCGFLTLRFSLKLFFFNFWMGWKLNRNQHKWRPFVQDVKNRPAVPYFNNFIE